MFPVLGLLRAVPCPERETCRRNCPFSHQAPPTPIAPPALERPSPAKRPRIEAPAPALPKASSPQRAAGPPRLQSALGSHSPLALRNEILKLLYNAFFDCYALLPTRRDLAYAHASEQEKSIYRATKAHSYKTMASQAIQKIKKRPRPRSLDDNHVGLIEEVDSREKESRAENTKPPDLTALLTAKSVKPYTLANAPAIATKDYIASVPPESGGSTPTQAGMARTCDRCKKAFIVKALANEKDRTACRYHWGKLRNERGGGPTARRVFTCCGSTAPCSIGAHVFVDSDSSTLHARAAFVHTASRTSGAAAAAEVLAVDCELVYTTGGLSLARVTAVLPGSPTPALDEFVRPPGPVLDCNTRFSGIQSPEELEIKAVLDLEGIRRALGGFIGPDTVLVGHGLENDLKALRLVHPLDRVVDTAILYPHPAGFPIRHSLRNLVKSYLGTFIQDEGSHDSAVDARTALELVALKVAAKGAEPRKLV